MADLAGTEARAIDGAVRPVIEDVAPDARYEEKDGADAILPDPDGDALTGGIFVHGEHVSPEFGEGASFSGPGGLLEGKGETRRHLAFRQRDDVGDKNARAYLERAFEKDEGR